MDVNSSFHNSIVLTLSRYSMHFMKWGLHMVYTAITVQVVIESKCISYCTAKLFKLLKVKFSGQNKTIYILLKHILVDHELS